MHSLPNYWYNIVPDLPRPLPPPRDPEDDYILSRIELLAKLFLPELLDQEFTAERYVQIPSETLDSYRRIGRPTPLVRAEKLEKFLDTPAKIYFKREDLSPAGSHKVNTALAQAYYAKKGNVRMLTTETSAGQWGSALAYACAMFNIKCLVFMTRSSYLSKPYRRTLMNLYGAEVIPSPSERTEIGRKLLEENPEHPGSLGIAISEAIETCMKHEDVKYAIGSVMNFVLLHQTIIGLETMRQLKELGENPDIMIGCVGGGSNFAGFTFPFIGKRLRDGDFKDTRFIGVESKASPKMTKGNYVYEHGDTAGYLPMLKMYTVGRSYVPPPIHAAGLRYHAAAPTLSLLIREGLVETAAYSQEEVLEAAKIFTRVEGAVPAPETSHAIKQAIVEARQCRRRNAQKTIVLCFSGHGLLDLLVFEDAIKASESKHL
ncbi:MAG: TrpB-like pyridoxal phosphate-dependent enzyme [Candidatus Bathyarchaeia archaeon]